MNDFLTREQVIRRNLTKEQIIHRLEDNFQVKYCPECELDAWDQYLACEAVYEAERDYQIYLARRIMNDQDSQLKQDTDNKYAGLYAGVNGTCKPGANWKLTGDKLAALARLKKMTYLTPPIEIAPLLETILGTYRTTPGWWLTVAQHFTPRVLVWRINEMVKYTRGGWRTIHDPGAWLTERLKYTAQRKGIPPLVFKKRLPNS